MPCREEFGEGVLYKTLSWISLNERAVAVGIRVPQLVLNGRVMLILIHRIRASVHLLIHLLPNPVEFTIKPLRTGRSNCRFSKNRLGVGRRGWMDGHMIRERRGWWSSAFKARESWNVRRAFPLL